MKKLLSILIFLHCTSAWSLGYRHMITFGTHGLGWSGDAERLETKSNSSFERVDDLALNLGMNYAYLFSSRIQLGLFFQNSHDEYKFYKRSGGSSTSEIESTNYGMFGLFNFSDELSDAFFIGLGASKFNHEEENAHDFTDAEGKNPFELDDTGETYEIVFGKRFNLKRWKIDHLTFSPQISFYHRTHAKDFNDQNIGDGMGFKLQLIKFDFLF